ncbi:MAG: hypothetical protein KAI86_11780 [Desulfobacterales bacterium]|nr:hypothetical protein [Desulfobacterales bacterium]
MLHEKNVLRVTFLETTEGLISLILSSPSRYRVKVGVVMPQWKEEDVMEHSIMNNINELTVDSQVDRLPTLEEGILDVRQECGLDNPTSPETLRYSGGFGDQAVVPSIEQVSKSECVPRVERVLKKLDGILGFFLKILLPKSLTSTPPPDRQVFY